MGHGSELWLCEHLIWRTPGLPVLPSSQCHTASTGGSGSPKDAAGMTGHRHTSLALWL